MCRFKNVWCHDNLYLVKMFVFFILILDLCWSLKVQANGYEDAQKACLYDTKTYACTFADKPDFPEQPWEFTDHVGGAIWDGVRAFNTAFRTLQKFNIMPSSGHAGCGYGIDMGEILLNSLKTDLMLYTNKKKLSECQKACLSVCISSHYIKYTNPMLSCSSVAKIAATGEGACGNFSSFAVELMDSLGLKARTAYGIDGGSHNWVSVQVNGKSYSIEPQSSACHFSPESQATHPSKSIQNLQNGEWGSKQ